MRGLLRSYRMLVAGVVTAVVAACGHEWRVERAFDGHVVDGRYVEPRAYAAFLRAAIAMAREDTKEALAALDDAARLDPSSAEIWTRIGDVRCRADARDAKADAGFVHALELDPKYARAWAAKANCALARGDSIGAREAAVRAAEIDPMADGANVIIARTSSSEHAASTRTSLVALTLTAADPPVAWEALATWAKADGDVALWARALIELARVAPAKRDEIARAAEEMSGAGALWQARNVAAAATKAGESPLSGDRQLAARLALDDAIASGDPALVSQTATRVRMPLDEAAGRAFLAGDRVLAHALVSADARADPAAIGAYLMAAATGGRDLLGAILDGHSAGQEVSAAAYVALASALADATSAEQTRFALARLRHMPLLAGDDRVTRPAVVLAARGVLPVESLPADAAVELAALRGRTLPDGLLADATRLDARHQYLALAIARPASSQARELASHLCSSTDPVVAAAIAFIQLAGSAPIPTSAPRALLARDAADPLLATAARELARKVGDGETARLAREALKAMGVWSLGVAE